MDSEANPVHGVVVAVNPFTSADIESILAERGWLPAAISPQQRAWSEHAAALLGPQAADRAALADLLGLIFHYNAGEVMRNVESHAVMSRYAAREVIRRLAPPLLDGSPLTTERFQEVVMRLKDEMGIRGRELFHPLRLALTGRAGEGQLDRVILLIDEAAAAVFATPVKAARQRILEFCSALD
jgi:nondiscriminating glutamyl-tRNA synthetase